MGRTARPLRGPSASTRGSVLPRSKSTPSRVGSSAGSAGRRPRHRQYRKPNAPPHRRRQQPGDFLTDQPVLLQRRLQRARDGGASAITFGRCAAAQTNALRSRPGSALIVPAPDPDFPPRGRVRRAWRRRVMIRAQVCEAAAESLPPALHRLGGAALAKAPPASLSDLRDGQASRGPGGFPPGDVERFALRALVVAGRKAMTPALSVRPPRNDEASVESSDADLVDADPSISMTASRGMRSNFPMRKPGRSPDETRL